VITNKEVWMRVGFTGPARVLTNAEAGLIALTIGALRKVEIPVAFYSGGALGVDSLAFLMGVAIYPESHHRIVAPTGAAWEERLTAFAEQLDNVTIRFAKAGSTAAHSYMNRNDELVHQLAAGEPDKALLVAFPNSLKEQQRSGTWATIRRARAAGMEVKLVPLNEVDDD
jgi:hypothetical protein